MVFTTLAHLMDVEFLREAYFSLRKDAAPGVDDVTHSDYAIDLGNNLEGLHRRLKEKGYRATPAKRVWIDMQAHLYLLFFSFHCYEKISDNLISSFIYQVSNSSQLAKSFAKDKLAEVSTEHKEQLNRTGELI